MVVLGGGLDMGMENGERCERVGRGFVHRAKPSTQASSCVTGGPRGRGARLVGRGLDSPSQDAVRAKQSGSVPSSFRPYAPFRSRGLDQAFLLGRQIVGGNSKRTRRWECHRMVR